jgi:hypothetical protein
MTTSNSVDFSTNTNQIITDALLLCGGIGLEESVDNATYQAVSRALNRLVKSLENKGMHLWTKRECTIFLNNTSHEYFLGTTAHATENYWQTSTTLAAISGALAVTVADPSGINVGDHIGVVMDNGQLHWSLVFSKAGSLITMDTVLTDTVSVGNYVYTYTTKITKPLEILSVRRRDAQSSQDTPMLEMAYLDYQNLPTKTISPSTPIQWTTNRNLNSLSLFIWPISTNASFLLKATYIKQIEDFDTLTDTPDLPPEWYDPLVNQLAVNISPMFGKLNTKEFQMLQVLAAQMMADALSYDNEQTYVQLTPDYYGQR